MTNITNQTVLAQCTSGPQHIYSAYAVMENPTEKHIANDLEYLDVKAVSEQAEKYRYQIRFLIQRYRSWKREQSYKEVVDIESRREAAAFDLYYTHINKTYKTLQREYSVLYKNYMRQLKEKRQARFSGK